MMRNKRVLFSFACLAISFTLCLPLIFSGTVAHAEQVAEPNYMDMYLIAGQSNAAGTTNSGASGTFNNVMYAGQVNCNIGASIGTNDYMNSFSPSVKGGMGASKSQIGPEYGMASVLNSMYTSENKAMIFKSAAGGTALQNINEGLSATYGNWYPPSLRTVQSTNGATGVQYDKFVSNFQKVTAKLIEQGYTPRVVGMVWMQGEADRYSPTNYKTIIKAFISDMREDLGDVLDTDLSNMPFVMGEISLTFGSYNTSSVNRTFNDMLNTIPSEVGYTGVINSGKYLIHGEGNVVLGSDNYHWNSADMQEIGTLFAQKVLALAAEKVVDADADGNGSFSFSRGTIDYAVSAGQVTLTIKPASGCTLESLKVGGAEVTVTDNVYTTTASGSLTIEATFVPLPGFRVTYTSPELAKGRLIYGEYCLPEYPEGAQVLVKVAPTVGFEVDRILFNDVPMTYDAERDVYVSTPIDRDSRVVAYFRAKETASTTNDRESGCGSAMSALSSVFAALGISALFFKRVA